MRKRKWMLNFNIWSSFLLRSRRLPVFFYNFKGVSGTQERRFLTILLVKTHTIARYYLSFLHVPPFLTWTRYFQSDLGHSRAWNFLFQIQSIVYLLWCFGTLSFWKIQPRSKSNFRAEGKTLQFNISRDLAGLLCRQWILFCLFQLQQVTLKS